MNGNMAVSFEEDDQAQHGKLRSHLDIKESKCDPDRKE